MSAASRVFVIINQLRRLAFMALPCVLSLAALSLHAAPVRHIFFVGDSITHHNPAEHLGWKGNWGMAASRIELDYVHRLAARFAETQEASPVFTINAVGGGTIAGKLADAERINTQAARADLIIIQLGENDHEVTDSGFRQPYEQLVEIVRKANPSARLICTATWAPPAGSHEKDAFIREICSRLRIPYADLSDANKDPRNQAGASGLWTHRGVNWHPGDAGMAAYADAIWQAFHAGDAAIPSASAVRVSQVAEELLFQERFEDPESLARWRVKPEQVALGQSGNTLRLTNPDAGASVYVRHTLEVARFAGRRVKLSARIGGRNISAAPKPWNGIKLMLDLQDAEGRVDHPQAPAAFAGSFESREVHFTRYIPDTTVRLQLTLGLERVSGALSIEDIRITAVP